MADWTRPIVISSPDLCVGSESDNTIQFTVPNNPNVKTNGAITTNDDDRNNNCASCQPASGEHVDCADGCDNVNFNVGTNIPAFTLTDISGSGGTVTNGGTNPILASLSKFDMPVRGLQ